MLRAALPFWRSLSLAPLVALAASYGGWWLAAVPIYGWIVMSVLDRIWGLDEENPDPNGEHDLFWHSLVTWVWLPIQIVLIFGSIYATTLGHLAGWEQWVLMMSLGVVTGTVGINFAHELIHQKNRWELWMCEWLLISTLYGHFKSEHLLVHHRYIGTPRDPVTAKYNEGFYRYFPRVLVQCVRSAWIAEAALLARKGLGPLAPANPFWRYVGGGLAFMGLAYGIAGWVGVGLFLIQAFHAILQLELVNYIEHYGLTRKHLGDGKYEHVKPRHSWNAAHRITNYLLINLQRHSDHHYKPDRRFPLLQTYSEEDAPQLPYGYPLMTLFALVPPVFRRLMNPRVRAWRKRYYPEISDWTPYKHGTNPLPR